jgi:DNA-binding CsgD family transcriptional regulator
MANNDKVQSDKAKHKVLTDMEMEVLRLLAVGTGNEEIAKIQGISLHEVEVHISRIFEKIRAPNTFQAVLWAARNL